jgi:hypothetical protein
MHVFIHLITSTSDYHTKDTTSWHSRSCEGGNSYQQHLYVKVYVVLLIDDIITWL